jgi:hypothetical protein
MASQATVLRRSAPQEAGGSDASRGHPDLEPIPGPSVLLHPRVADALTLAARPIEVVAEVLSDGTVRPVGTGERARDGKPFSSGTVAGDGWTLWWQRRSWAQERTA